MKKLALGMLQLVLVACAGVAWSQSHDPAHPTPLGAGVNKGNIVNFDGPQYYYFYGGPGRFDIRMAFHEMGMFGNPFRQTLSFDFTNAAGKNIWHGVITSQGNTAEIKTYGDYKERKRVMVTVTAMNGLVRCGGYYEFEVTGAASFDGKTGSTAGVKLEASPPLVTGGHGPLVKSVGPLVKSGGPLVTSSGGPLVKSGGPLVYPGKPLIVEETPQKLRISMAADVLFNFGKADIRPDAETTLRQAATKLKFSKARGPILIEGFTDARGTGELNLRLSKARADAVETWLIQNAGFSVARLNSKGYGAARPVAPNLKPDGTDNPAGRQQNRRVEIVVAK